MWRTLLRAARIQSHVRVLEVTEDIPEGQIPAIYEHRKCFSIFSMKKVNWLEKKSKVLMALLKIKNRMVGEHWEQSATIIIIYKNY